MNDLISIIIPVYKAEKYLDKCVESLLNQSYGNLEIILVNDGSPDRSGEMCDAFSKKDARVKVLHKTNGGPASAQNAGLDIAAGKYIAFLDNDDWVHQEYIQKLYHLLLSTDSEIAVCNFLKVYVDRMEEQQSNIKIYEYSKIEALEQLVGQHSVQFAVAWGKVYDKKLFKNFRYPDGKNHEDEFAIHHLLLKVKKVAYTTEPLYYYLQREDSIMGQGFDPQMNLDKIEAFTERIKIFQDFGLTESIDYMYADIFHMYRQIYAYSQGDFQKISRSELNNLKNILRAGNYKVKFKLFYELYYLIPSVMDRVYHLIRS